MRFEEATAVQHDAPGRYSGVVQPGWAIAGNVNGGYLLAIAACAMSSAASDRLPASITAHYLRPGTAGPVSVETKVVKEGKSFSTVSAQLGAENGSLMALVGSFAAHDRVKGGVERVDARPTEMPPPGECVSSGARDGAPEFMDRIDLRLHPEDATFDSGEPKVRGWFRLHEDEPIDAFGLMVAVDAMPPTIFNARLPVAWTPTLELTAHVRGVPAPGWLRCSFTTRFISDGFLEEDGEIWDSTGRLVAQSRQLALLPRS